MSSSHGEPKKPPARAPLDPLITTDPGPSKFELVQNAIFSRFTHRKHDSTKILSDLAPVIMTPRMINSTANASLRRQTLGPASKPMANSKLDFATLGRAPLKLGLGSRRITSGDLQIVEATDELLESEIPEPDGVASDVSLLRGFNATIPSAEQGRARRRQMRSVETPRIGLKRLGMSARGLMTDDDEHDGHSVEKESGGGRESLSTAKTLGKDELTRQSKEIIRDKENIHVRRNLVHSEIAEISHKIAALDAIRAKLEQDLLKLHEDELELDDELEGVKERLDFEQSHLQKASTQQPFQLPHHTSRRRKGPAFLPSEHDELPPGVAFMTLDGHTTPLTALDFSEPYGTLVSASQDDAQPRVWDLFSGTEIGRLRGHTGTVKALQVQDTVCLTGGEDGNVRLWDLRRVDAEPADSWADVGELVTLSEEDEDQETDRDPEAASGTTRVRAGKERAVEQDDCCARVLEGHTKAVTALYFEDDCLVTGASDKTLRQWDLTTGQCVMTMDILWAISHAHQPRNSVSGGILPNNLFSGAAASVGSFGVPMPPYADGTWDMYEDFVGGVQFWGYGLVSGSGDGAVRMWDMRTGQAHRTLLGHTAPVTCVQFDEIHIASGSLDKTLRIWDLRTGGVFETLKYDHAVTSLQFDTRKIVAATGENGIKIYNRTSMQQSTLQTNGHMKPVERVRYMDRYLVSGGRDATVKIWSL
ncbi:Trp-Asp repeats containing protein [Mycena indigotica]|uniref:Trp-Asp repeats containing protein n=1 Tax=Mycena indigotica TaxID=2126181 RepID=A0A8H6SUM6_9AGAR|nr:Trp-Asp repeats containing protein [Mycena indigotica]KAF7306485.1 Trp-Asp repeats containing protein [Mycena indigotica]